MPDKLVVLWTSGDREVALKMAFMYTFNAKAQLWWKDVTLIVWGASARLLAVDLELREYAHRMLDSGIKIQACKACADSYGVSDNLASLGVEVRGMGQPLTEYLKDTNTRVITI
ncbi:DsrE family protein [bacterium]|nr:DsrE family protein [bacterium]